MYVYNGRCRHCQSEQDVSYDSYGFLLDGDERFWACPRCGILAYVPRFFTRTGLRIWRERQAGYISTYPFVRQLLILVEKADAEAKRRIEVVKLSCPKCGDPMVENEREQLCRACGRVGVVAGTFKAHYSLVGPDPPVL